MYLKVKIRMINNEKIYLVAKWVFKPGTLKDIKEDLVQLISRSRAEAGNVVYDMHQTSEDDHTILIYEGYKDSEALEFHKSSSHYTEIVQNKIVPLLEERKITFLNSHIKIESNKKIMSKKILFIVSSANKIGPNNRATGNFLPEVAHPYAEFIAKGYEIDFASIEGGEPALDGLDFEDDGTNKEFLQGQGYEAYKASMKLADVDVSKYDAVFIPGGLAPMVDLPDNALVQKAIAETYERGAVIGTVCHGPASLVNVKLSDGSYLIDGKSLTSFSNAEEENYAKQDVPFLLETALRNHGANFKAVESWKDHSIADGSLVTGQNPQSSKSVAQKMVAFIESIRK